VTYKPFTLSEEELLSLGKKFFNSLLTQNKVERLHDYPITEENDKAKKYLREFQKGTKVLFLGCGSGRELIHAEALGLDAYGVTLGQRNIEFGIKTLSLSPTKFKEACAELLPFPAKTFDVVAGFQIFEHAIGPMMFLLEQSRVLKDNGAIVLEWPAASFHSANGKDPQHQVCYTPGQAEALLLKAGFDNIRMFYADMSTVPKEKYWTGEREKGYLIVKANKIESEAPHVVGARDWRIQQDE